MLSPLEIITENAWLVNKILIQYNIAQIYIREEFSGSEAEEVIKYYCL